MKTPVILLLFLLALQAQAGSYINYSMMNTAIKHTLEEHERQTKIKENQFIVGGLEQENRAGFSAFRQSYKKVEARMNSLGLLIDAGLLVREAIPLVGSIRQSQEELIALLWTHPTLTLSVIDVEQELLEQAGSLLNYMAGILLTYGDINRMKSSDRKLLLNFARDELRALDGQSYCLLNTVRHRLQFGQNSLTAFVSWVNRDEDLIRYMIKKAQNSP